MALVACGPGPLLAAQYSAWPGSARALGVGGQGFCPEYGVKLCQPSSTLCCVPYTSLSLKLPICKWAQESLSNPATREDVKISWSFPKQCPVSEPMFRAEKLSPPPCPIPTIQAE